MISATGFPARVDNANGGPAIVFFFVPDDGLAFPYMALEMLLVFTIYIDGLLDVI